MVPDPASATRITSEDEHSAKFAVLKRAGQWSRGRAESSVQPQQWMKCRRHRTGPDSGQIPRPDAPALVRDNQTDLHGGLFGPVSDPYPIVACTVM
jgi:hypothetical protein